MYRTCKKCHQKFSLNNFPIHKFKEDKEYRRHYCIECFRKSNKNIRVKMIEYKKTLHCAKCQLDDYRVLEFHHFENNKKYTINYMVKNGYAWDSIMQEVSKCIVLCANCHRIHHSQMI